MALLWKIKMWIGWLIGSKNDRWLHPPWLFSLYQRAFRTKREEDLWGEFETLRREMEQSHQFLTFQDPGSGRLIGRKVSDQAKQTLLPAGACRFLSALADQLKCGAVLELGSSLGITTLYLAGNQRRVITLEGAEPVFSIAKRNFERFPELKIEAIHARFDLALDSVLVNLASDFPSGVILVWLDGHHDEAATETYVGLIFQALGSRAVFVLDDIRWSKGMHRAWKKACESGNWSVCIDLHRMGILISNSEFSSGAYKLRPPIKNWTAFL